MMAKENFVSDLPLHDPVMFKFKNMSAFKTTVPLADLKGKGKAIFMDKILLQLIQS
jgi:hypothetical protein